MKHGIHNRPGVQKTRIAAGIMLLCLAAIGPGAWGQSNLPTTSTWVTNGRVYAIACTSTTIFIGGNFNQVGPATTTTGWITRNKIAALDAATGMATVWNPNIDGTVLSLAVSDGVVYAGGSFNSVGGQLHKGLVALDATTGQAKPWNPAMISESTAVNAILVSGSTLYVGGTFRDLDGQPGLNYLAALNAESGHPTGWNPKANNYAYGLALYNGNLYACGKFTNIGGQSRNYIAALETVTTNTISWNPGANNEVLRLHSLGSILYATGYFTSIGGQSRNRIAALDINTGQPTNWDPNANNYVQSMAISDNKLYVTGGFTTIGGQWRNKLAALDLTTGLATPWNPNQNGNVSALALTSSTLYVGGDFTSISGQPWPNLARFDPVPPLGTPFNPYASDIQKNQIAWAWQENASSETGFKVFLDPGSAAPVTLRDTLPENSTLWVSKDLTPNTQYSFQVAATDGITDSSRTPVMSRFTLAAQPKTGMNIVCDHTTGTSLGWHTNLTFSNPAGFGPGVHGGHPWGVSGFRYAWDMNATHAFSGSDAVWNNGSLVLTHNVEGYYYLHIQSISAESVFGETLDIGPFVFGPFENEHPVAGALSQTPTSSTWATDGIVRDIVCTSTTVYIAGEFHKVGPVGTTSGWVTRNYIAALDIQTGKATNWNPDANNVVYTLSSLGATVYAGGKFTSIGGQTRYGLAALDGNTGQATAWNPMNTYEIQNGVLDPFVRAVTVSSSNVYLGGRLTWRPLPGDPGATTSRNMIIKINASDGHIIEWTPDPNNYPLDLLVSSSTLYAAGYFSNIMGQPRKCIAALDANTGILKSWNPISNASWIYGLEIANNTILIGGKYSNIGGQDRSCIAALDVASPYAIDWNPNASGGIYFETEVGPLTIVRDTLIVGGSFTAIGGKPRNHLSALDIISGMATNWNPDVNNAILATAFSGSSLYVGGHFTTIGGQPRPYFACFDLLTSPTIQNQPKPQVVNQGAAASFIITASGQELTYQWLKDGTDLANGGRIAGADTVSLAISDARPEDAGLYSCRVANGAGTVTSAAARLTVRAPSGGGREWRGYR